MLGSKSFIFQRGITTSNSRETEGGEEEAGTSQSEDKSVCLLLFKHPALAEERQTVQKMNACPKTSISSITRDEISPVALGCVVKQQMGRKTYHLINCTNLNISSNPIRNRWL